MKPISITVHEDCLWVLFDDGSLWFSSDRGWVKMYQLPEELIEEIDDPVKVEKK